jgi:hypothetical protein
VMLEQLAGDGRVNVGADKGYDTAEFVDQCRHMNVTPHVSQNTARPGGSVIDARTTRHAGYDVSQKKRKRIEECFGWVEGHRAATQTEASWSIQSGMDLHLRSSGLQPCTYAKADSDSSPRMTEPKCLCRQNESPAGQRNITR